MKKLIPLAALLLAAACSTSTLVTDLNAIIAAVDAALPILQSTGAISPAAQQMATDYLTLVSNATSQAATEMQSNDSDVVKATKLAALFDNVVLPAIPSAPQSLVADLNAIAAAVNAFENAVEASRAQASPAQARKFHLTERDKTQLASIKAKADSALATLHAPAAQ